jgi:hypothetical protein
MQRNYSPTLAPALGLKTRSRKRWSATHWMLRWIQPYWQSCWKRVAMMFSVAMMPLLGLAQPATALNPDVHPDTINDTICVVGYTKTVRPSTSYTSGVKRLLLSRAGLSYEDKRDYELDHIIPLALGGHPRSLTNLMLQPWEGEDGAKRKDKLEVKLQCLVCTGKVALDEARAAIFNDWQAAAKKYQHLRCSRKKYEGD